MEIARDRFLDDTRRYHVTLSLRSRTTEMHSLLSGLGTGERDTINAVLVRALDDIEAVLQGHQRATARERAVELAAP